MAVPGKRLLKRKNAIPPGQEGIDTSHGFRIRLDAKTMSGVVLFLIVAAAIAIYFKSPGKPQSSPSSGVTGVAVPATTGNGPADTQLVQNRSPSVVKAAITISDPVASTALQVRYTAEDPDGDPLAVDIRWYVDDNLVQSGPSDVLQPGVFRKGSSVYAEIIPADQQSNGNVYKSSPVIIKNSPPQISALLLEPETVFVGTVITATPSGTDPDEDQIEYRYEWRVNGNPAESATGKNSFSTASLRKHDIVTVAIEASDGHLKGGMIVSSEIPLKNRKPEIISSPTTSPLDGVYLYRVEARDSDGDSLRYRLSVYPEGMAIDPASGVVRWELQKGSLYAGRNEIPVRISVDDRDGGMAAQEFVIVLTDYVAY